MIIGISGLIGSGKGTVADMLVSTHGLTKISFADSLKDAVAAVFSWPRELLEGDTAESRQWRERVDAWWAERLSMPNLTPRWVLQYWGTEVLRRGFHEDIWIASIQNKLRNATGPGVVIPDMRFPNEIALLKQLAGHTWLVKRGQNPSWLTAYQAGDDAAAQGIHPSEYMWARSHMDAIIHNDGTLHDLRHAVDSLISKYR